MADGVFTRRMAIRGVTSLWRKHKAYSIESTTEECENEGRAEQVSYCTVVAL